MAVTAVISDRCKYALPKKMLDLSSGGDSLKIILMRSGFTFDKRVHGLYVNVMGTMTRTDISFVAAGNHIHTVAGDLQAAGFVSGMKIVISGTVHNNGTFTIVAVGSAIDMTVTESITDESAGSSFTVAGNDELETGYGYDRNTKTLASVALTEDNVTNDQAVMTCATVTWSASGGSIGPTPGAIIFDDTVSEKTILGYINFDGNQTAVSGAGFSISSIALDVS